MYLFFYVCLHSKSRFHPKVNQETEYKEEYKSNLEIDRSKSKSKSPAPPKSPPPPRPKSAKQSQKPSLKPSNLPNRLNSADDIEFANIEQLRSSTDDFGSSASLIENPFSTLRFEPNVIDRFPPLDHEDTAIISTDTQLQYFCLPTGLFLTKFPSLPIFYTFVWTPETGEHLYGCCLRFFEQVDPQKVYQFCQDAKKDDNKEHYESDDDILPLYANMTLPECKGYFAPKCICVISYHSFITGYRTFLTELYRLSLTPNTIPIERYLCNFFLECPLAPRGYFSVRYNIGDKSFVMARAPSNDPLSKSSISTRILFELFTIDTIMNIYKAILMEEKILFVSTQYSILSLITEIFVSLLYPFTWPHVYIPLLPEDFLAFLKAPTVFMIGTHKSLLLQIGEDLDDDILVIDINHGTMNYGVKHMMAAYTAKSPTAADTDSSSIGSPQPPTIPSNPSLSSSPSFGYGHGHIELPKHEKSKLVRFLNDVSNLLYGSHKHDFHQLDLAFPVAPTPDMIEEQEKLQQERLQKMKSHASSTRSVMSNVSNGSIMEKIKNRRNSDSFKMDRKARSGSISSSNRSSDQDTVGDLPFENMNGNDKAGNVMLMYYVLFVDVMWALTNHHSHSR